VRLARENPGAKILLASFSQPLADAMAKKTLVLAPETGGIVRRITTASFRGIAEQMYQLEYGVRPRVASDAILRERLRAAAATTGLKGFSERFLLSEWTNVVDAWSLSSLGAYSSVERMGRKSRLGPNQRARLWPVFAAVHEGLATERYTTWANVFTGLAKALEGRPSRARDISTWLQHPGGPSSAIDPFPRAISSQLLSLGPCALDQNARDRPKRIEFRGQVVYSQ
jgi:hypothetical protein